VADEAEQVSPQQKSLVTLLGLVVAAGALGLYAYFGVMKADEAEQERKETSDKLFAARAPGEKSPDGGVPGAPVFTYLTLTAKGQTTVLEKGQDGKWRIISPIKARADEAAVESITSQLADAKMKATIEENPAEQDLAKYGLKEPKFSVRAKAHLPEDPKQEKEVSLVGGIENTFDGSVYMRRDGDKKVYSAEGGVRYALDKSTYELRDKEILAFDEPKLKAIEVKTGKNAYTLERDDKQAWRVTKPVALAAEGPTVVGMLSALKNERALSFPTDSPEERKKLGFDAPALDAWLTPESGDRIHVRMARTAEKGYVLREQGAEAVLAEVSSGAVAHLDKAPMELRDKTVLALKKDDVVKLAFTPAGGGPEIVVQRSAADAGPDDWAVVAPDKGPAKKWKISSILWTLGSLKASGFGPESPKDWSKYGLDAKARAVTASDAAGQVLAKLWVGKDVPGKTNTAYVRGSANQVLEMDTSRLTDLPATVADVLDTPQPAAGAPDSDPAAPMGAALKPR
jgi:hypothetical protein